MSRKKLHVEIDPEEPDRTLESDLLYYDLDEMTKVSIRQLERTMTDRTSDYSDILVLLPEAIQRPEPRIIFKKHSDMERRFSTRDNSSEIKVYFSKLKDGKWLKLYVLLYAVDAINVAKSEFLFEVYYQKKAFELNSKCNFISPNIHDYGYFVTDYNYCLYMIMDFIPENNMTNAQCESITPSILAVDKCLQENNVAHNDVTQRNVRVREVDSKNIPILFDYGEAQNKLMFPHEWRCLPDPGATTRPKFVIGQYISARYDGRDYYPGTIESINTDGTYNILYKDGDREANVRPKFVRNNVSEYSETIKRNVGLWDRMDALDDERLFGKGGAITNKRNLTTRKTSRHINKRNKTKYNKRKTKKHRKLIHSKKKRINIK